MRFFKTYKREILSVLGLVIPVIAIIFGTYYASRLQEQANKSRASGDASLYFAPAEIDADINTVLTPVIQVNPMTESVTAIELHLSFDPSKISIESITNAPGFPTILQASSISNSDGLASMIIGVASTAVTDISDAFNITVKTKGVYGDTTINISQTSQVAGLGKDTTVLGTLGQMVVHIIDPNATIPPTATGTSEATATATSTTVATEAATSQATATATSVTTATGTSEATASPTATATSTSGIGGYTEGEPNSCGGTCGSNYNCKSNLYCYQGFCRNPICKESSDCNCTTATTKPVVTVAPVKSDTVSVVNKATSKATAQSEELVNLEEKLTADISTTPTNTYNPDVEITTEELKSNASTNTAKYVMAGVIVSIIGISMWLFSVSKKMG
jgi:hypothetical protein